MLGPETQTIADTGGGKPPFDIGSRLCTQCGLCCTGALHNYAVLQPEEVEFARGLGLTIRTEGKPGFALPCPHLVDSKCSIYKSRPKVCSKYKCQLLENVEAGTTAFASAIDKVAIAKDLVARVDAVMPNGMTLPEARDQTKVGLRANPETEASPAERLVDMPLKLAVTALSHYLDKYFRNSSEGKMLSLEPIADEQPTTEMK